MDRVTEAAMFYEDDEKRQGRTTYQIAVLFDVDQIDLHIEIDRLYRLEEKQNDH